MKRNTDVASTIKPGYPWWLEEALNSGADEPNTPPFVGHTSADVVIVGAGYTGLWTALSLLQKRPGLDVVVREKRWGMLSRDDIGHVGDEFEKLPRGRHLLLPNDEREIAKARLWSRAPGVDVALSIAVMTLIAIAFTVNGANLLHEQQLVPAEDALLRHQAQFLEVINPALIYFYYVAIFFAFFGTVFGVWEEYSTTGYEALSAVFPKVRRLGRARVRQWIYPYVLIFALLLLWTASDPVSLITPALLFAGVFGIGIFALALLHTERRALPRAYRLKGIPWWLTLAAGIILTGFGVIAILQEIGIVPSA